MVFESNICNEFCFLKFIIVLNFLLVLSYTIKSFLLSFSIKPVAVIKVSLFKIGMPIVFSSKLIKSTPITELI